MKHISLYSAFESKKTDSARIEECPSFGEFSKAVSNLKKLATRVRKEMKHGTKSELDDYIEKRIFGRDV